MPCQYIEYLPFGEVMVQQSTNNIFENVYKFNAKELDESTGYSYYGARYYDPAISIFLSVDPLAEQFPNYNPYTYTMNNPVNLTDPPGMAPEGREDWVYDKSEGTYNWDSTVSKPSDITNSNYEYVGASTNDVKSHYSKNNPIKSFIGIEPNRGEDLNAPWSGEITPKEITNVDKWAESENVAAKLSYETLNDFHVTFQALNPFDDRVTTLQGYGLNSSEITDIGATTVGSMAPLAKGVNSSFKVLNASQFSSKFRGTFLTKTAHSTRGFYNRIYNKVMRSIDERGLYKNSVETTTTVTKQENKR
jgi:RHS repeat-associated protein